MIQFRWIPRLLRWVTPVRKGLQEASDQTLGKRNKLASLHELVNVQDYKLLGDADRAIVNDFRRSKAQLPMRSGGGNGSGDQDAWVCDDMTINTARSSLPEIILVALLALGAFWWFSKKDSKAPEVEALPVQSKFKVLFFDRDGNPIEVPHVDDLTKGN